jgi:hypothetical protein
MAMLDHYIELSQRATPAPRELDFRYCFLQDGFSSALNLISAPPAR